MSKLTPFGLFLHLKQLGRLGEYPAEQRQDIIDRINSILKNIEDRLANPPRKPGLPDRHYERERKLYKEDLFLAKHHWKL